MGGAIAGATIGAASSVINSYINGEQIDVESVLKSAAIGAIAGAAASAIAQIAPVLAKKVVVSAIDGEVLVKMIGSALNGVFAGSATKAAGGSTEDAIWTGATTTLATFAGASIPDFTGSTAVIATGNFITGFYIGGATESIASVARAGGRTIQTSRSGKTVSSTRLGYVGLRTRAEVGSYRGCLILR